MRIFPRNKSSSTLILIITLFVIFAMAGCFAKPTPPPQKDKETAEITLYFDASTSNNEYLATEKRKVEEGNLPLKSMEELIKGPSDESDLKPVLPKEAKINSVEIKENIAYVDFNKALPENLNVGSSGEVIVLSAIVNTLTEFPEIERVQILIDGEKIESLAGHIVITEPIERNEDIIKK